MALLTHFPQKVSSNAVYNTIPTLLYGAESWILNTTLLMELESFQGEVGKRILQLPKFAAC